MKKIRVYDSIDEMTAAADKAHAAGKVYPMHGSWFTGRDGLNVWSDAKKMAGALWADGVAKVRELAAEAGADVTVKPVSRKRRKSWSEDGGDEIDMDRVRAGQAPWLECTRQSVTAPQNVTLVIDLSTKWTIKAEAILWRGAAALVIADLLEAAGFNVEIFAVNNSIRTFRSGAGFLQAYRLKRSDQPLDVASLTNGLSGWFYRTVIFQSFYADGKPQKHHGIPRPLDVGEVAEAIGTTGRPVVIEGIWDKAAAVSLVRDVIATFNPAE